MENRCLSFVGRTHTLSVNRGVVYSVIPNVNEDNTSRWFTGNDVTGHYPLVSICVHSWFNNSALRILFISVTIARHKHEIIFLVVLPDLLPRSLR